MTGLLFASFEFITPWMYGAFALVICSVLAFAGGMAYARCSMVDRVENAAGKLSGLFDQMLQKLSSAEVACARFEKQSAEKLSPEQGELLQQKQQKLWQSASRILSEKVEQPAPESKAKARKKSFPSKWETSPVDSKTDLPAAETLSTNLRRVVGLSPGGLLLLKLDTAEKLQQRFGPEAVLSFQKTFIRIVYREMSDADLLCQFGDSSFALLLPKRKPEEVLELSSSIREAIRSHRFSLPETEQEVLVTASLGMALTTAVDDPKLLRNRAVSALLESHKNGRNQLHLHDGKAVITPESFLLSHQTV